MAATRHEEIQLLSFLCQPITYQLYSNLCSKILPRDVESRVFVIFTSF